MSSVTYENVRLRLRSGKDGASFRRQLENSKYLLNLLSAGKRNVHGIGTAIFGIEFVFVLECPCRFREPTVKLLLFVLSISAGARSKYIRGCS